MGRLTRRSNDEIFLTCGFYSSYYWKQNPFYEAVDKLAHYEDLEEQLMESAEIDIDSMVGEFMHYYNLQKENRLIELPCAVGEIVWIARDGVPVQESIFFSQSDILCLVEDGYIFGTTKEEAEAKLKELEE